MTETIRDKIARQLEIEDEARALGARRYRSSRPLPWRTETASTEEEAQLPPGRKLLKLALEPTAEALREFVDRVAHGGAGRRPVAYRILSQIGAEEAAYLTGRVVVNAAASGLSSTATAFAIAASIIEHVEMTNLKERNKEGFKGLVKKAKRMSGSIKARRAVKEIMKAEETNVSVPQAEQLQVGMKCLEVFLDTGLFAMELAPGKRGDVYVIRPTEAVAKWLEVQHARCELLEPMHMPMVVRPKRWRSPFSGGYLTRRPGQRLVKQWNAEYHDQLKTLEMPKVYAAVNAVQDVAWAINGDVLELMRQVWDDGGSLGGLPRRDDVELPAKPVDFEVNPEAAKDWKRSAARVHETNAHSLSGRLALQRRLWIAAKFAEEEAIYFPHELDFRGRIYPIPTGGPHPQGDDSAKALLQFSEGKPLGPDGGRWLAIHLANLFGVDKVSFDERVAWVRANTALIEDSARNPLDGERFWTTADSPWCALAACREWLGYLSFGEDFVSHLPVALDGSNSGLQHFSAMLRDPVGAASVSMLPAPKPSDVYADVATRAQAIVDTQPTATIKVSGEERSFPNPWLGGKVSRKIAKRPCMTYVYSATRFGMQDMILQTLAELDAEAKAAGELPYLEGASNYDAAMYLSHVMWEAIQQTVVAASGAMEWLRASAKVMTKAGLPITWTTPQGLPVLQHYRNVDGKRISVYLAGRRMDVQIAVDGVALNGNAQANGIAPNFVHSLDAAHLMAVANACVSAGIDALAVIHDSFGTHAADAANLSAVLRDTFIDQYAPDVLARFRDELLTQLPEQFHDQLPPLPALGDLDLQVLRSAAYMFA